jgi:hypothetical protein
MSRSRAVKRVLNWCMGLLCLGAGALAFSLAGGRLDADHLLSLGAEQRLARVADGLPERATARYFGAIADAALNTAPPDWDLARSAVQAALAREAREAGYWVELSYIERYAPDGDRRASIAAMREAYRLSPYGKPDFMAGRLEFVVRYWVVWDGDIQAAALREARYFRAVHALRYRTLLRTMPLAPEEFRTLAQ